MSVINKTTELLPTPTGRSSGSKEPCPDFPFPSQGTAQPPLPLDQHLAPTFTFKEDPLLLHRGFSVLTGTLHVLPAFLVSIDRETLRMKSIHHSLLLEAACLPFIRRLSFPIMTGNRLQSQYCVLNSAFHS